MSDEWARVTGDLAALVRAAKGDEPRWLALMEMLDLIVYLSNYGRWECGGWRPPVLIVEGEAVRLESQGPPPSRLVVSGGDGPAKVEVG